MWLRKPLDDILSCPAKIAVLRAILQVNTPLSGREIARRAEVGYSPAYNALQALAASGVLSKRYHGRVNTYELAEPQSPLTRRLRDLFMAEARHHREVTERLSKEVPGLLSVVLFGSEARGEAKPGSDTDLLIVVEKTTKRLEDQITDTCVQLAAEYQLALSWVVADVKELQEWETEGNGLWRNIQSEGIRLAGKPLERLMG